MAEIQKLGEWDCIDFDGERTQIQVCHGFGTHNPSVCLACDRVRAPWCSLNFEIIIVNLISH
jgi:hypothetical protein